MNVGIIGGGALGLAAAYELTQAGHSVAVYERAPVLGGQAGSGAVLGCGRSCPGPLKAHRSRSPFGSGLLGGSG